MVEKVKKLKQSTFIVNTDHANATNGAYVVHLDPLS